MILQDISMFSSVHFVKLDLIIFLRNVVRVIEFDGEHIIFAHRSAKISLDVKYFQTIARRLE